MSEKAKRKLSPSEELFKQVLSKMTRVDKRLSAIEQQLVLNQNELVRHGRLIEDINSLYLEKLGGKFHKELKLMDEANEA
jgi:hypothetical protein